MPDFQIERIKPVHLFKEMNDRNLSILMKDASVESIPSQTTLIKQSQRVRILHTILNGSADLCAHIDGRETVIGLVGRRDVINLASVVSNSPSCTSVRTLEACEILSIPAEAVSHL